MAFERKTRRRVSWAVSRCWEEGEEGRESDFRFRKQGQQWAGATVLTEDFGGYTFLMCLISGVLIHSIFLILLYAFFFETQMNSMNSRLSLNSPCRQRRLCAPDGPVFTSQVLLLQTCASIPGLCSSGAQAHLCIWTSGLPTELHPGVYPISTHGSRLVFGL